MKIHTFSIYLNAFLISAAFAVDEVRFDSLLGYKNVVILKVEPDGIQIRHEDGVQKIRVEDLPEDIREKAGISTGEHARVWREERETQARKEARYAQALASVIKGRLIITAQVLQVLEHGVLLKNVSDRTNEKNFTTSTYHVVKDGPTTLNPNRPIEYGRRVKTDWEFKFRDFDLMFVSCNPSGYADGDSFRGTVFPDGTFSYINLEDWKRTVPKYSLNAQDVANRMIQE